MNRKYFFSLLGFCLAAAAAIQFYIYSSGYYSISSDESARTLVAYDWYKNKTITAEVWLPLHSIILGCSLGINKNLITTPRMVSLLFGLSSIIGLALLTQYLFENNSITLLASFLYAVLPERIMLTAVPLPEIIFICFILFGSVFLMKWIRQKKNPDLLYASFFWMIGGGLRYEGWIFSASMFFFSIYELQKKNLSFKHFTIIFLILTSFPLYWMLLNQLKNGSPFTFLTTTVNMFESKYGSSFLESAYLSVLWQFFEQNYNSYNFIGLFGIFCLISQKKISRWTTVCFSGLFFMGIISALGKTLPSHNFWRTSAVWTILLIPFTSYLLYELSRHLILTKPVKINLAAVILVLLLAQFSIITLDRMDNMKSDYCLTRKDIAIGNTVDKILSGSLKGSSEKHDGPGLILIEKDRSFDHLNISVSLKNPENIIYYDKPGSNLPRCGPETIRSNFKITEIKKLKIGYLLVRSVKTQKYLSCQKDVQTLRKFGDWILYKII